MEVNEEDVKKVLALFDKEDIPYINFEYLINKNIIESSNNINRSSNPIVKARKMGGKNDRSRK